MTKLKLNTVCHEFRGAKGRAWFMPILWVLACVGCSDGGSSNAYDSEAAVPTEQTYQAPAAEATIAMDDSVMDDSVMDDSAMNDSAMDDSALSDSRLDDSHSGTLEELKDQAADEVNAALENQMDDLGPGIADQPLGKLKQISAEEFKEMVTDEEYEDVVNLINPN